METGSQAKEHGVAFGTLVDWVEGRLGPDQERAVAAEVAVAGPDTRQALSWLRQFETLAAELALCTPPPSVGEELERRFQQRVAAQDRAVLRALLVWDSQRQVSLAGARTAGLLSREHRHLVYEADGIDITFDLHLVGERWVRVEGQVLPPPDVVAPIAEIRLIRERRGVARAALDELGTFVLDRVAQGSYAMLLLGGSLRIELTIDLELEPSP